VESPLLVTKLNIPPLRLPQVTRPRLLARLETCLNYTLTLVAAPAGFGKTTLLAEWVHKIRSSILAAWLSLEEADNDPHRFWEYFIAALRNLQPGIGKKSLALMGSTQPMPIQSVLTPLINELSGIPKDFVLVLDDYHFVQSQPVHEGVTFFLEHLPPRIHLVIATRADPPLPLAHFRGKGTMLEIGADDLRFSFEEALSLLKELKVPELPVENIKALNDKAEGWAAGLKMAMLSLRGEKDIPGFISGFTGTQRYIMDYLVEEVLQRQTPEVRDFLLKTSVLERLNGPLCDAVTGRHDGRENLNSLEKANLFLVPLDESRQWYRYEHLFGELLRHRLEIEFGLGKSNDLHRLASSWHEGNGFMEKAVDHALAARDWEKAINLVMSMKPLVDYGGATVYNWLRQVPLEVLITHQVAYIFFIWSMVIAGQVKAGRDLLDKYEKSAVFDDFSMGLIAGLRANIANYLRDPRTEEYTLKAISLLPPDDPLGRMILSLQLGVHFMTTHRYNKAEPFLSESHAFFRQNGPLAMANTALVWLAVIAFFHGKLHRAEQMLKRGIRMVGLDAQTASNHLILSTIYHSWNDLERAAAEREKTISLFPDSWTMGTSYLYNAGASLIKGNTGAAAEALANAEKTLIKEDAAPELIARVAAYHVALALDEDDREAVSNWLGKLAQYKVPFLYDVPVSARRLVYERWGDAGRELLQAQYEEYQREGYQYLEMGVRLHQALTAVKPDEALSFIAEALVMAKPEGNIRILADYGLPIVPLLRRAIVGGIQPEFAHKILNIIEKEAVQRKIRKGEATPGAGLFSERELEVLKLVSEGLSNQQIAERLVISLSTAKSHVYHIFDKLEAKDRLQAVNRARELKLI
jgi:LuxR family maltose regulon positive regulatory protein